MFRADPIGAPGVYFAPPQRDRRLVAERMDVCGFAGIAPRGPSRVAELPEWWRREDGPYVRQWRGGVFATRRTLPVAVDSFDEYLFRFGAFDGPGRLPYAVAAFFEQGGRRAWISRIVHDYGNPADDAGGVAYGTVDGGLPANGTEFKFRARNEGGWGNRLRVAIGYTLRPLQPLEADSATLVFAGGEDVSSGSLLRLRFPGNVFELRFAGDVQLTQSGGRRERRVTFSPPLPAVPEAVELVEGELVVDDGDGRRETFSALGLSARHPRWLAAVVCYDSQLVYPEAGWSDSEIRPADPDVLPRRAVLPQVSAERAAQFGGGEDRYGDLAFDDFFDSAWSPADADPGQGVQAYARHPEIAALLVPDLYCPQAIRPPQQADQPLSLAGADFVECVDLPVNDEPPLQVAAGCPLALDPESAPDLEQIVVLQSRLVDFAETMRDFVVLLDVPPGLEETQVLRWRSRFRSSYSAAYLPWLQIAGRGADDTLLLLNPSAAAAGIIADSELRFGVPHGPANQLAVTAVSLDRVVGSSQHDALHPLGLNVFVRERDGIRLSAARTLTADYGVRQLSVRRLMILLRRVLGKQMHWMVFEPNGAALRRQVRRMLINYLTELYRAGAFTGASEEEAFFVRCDEHNNPPPVVDQGKLIAEVGVAPAEPLEFIVLRITRDGDGTLVTEQ